jgi:hypothetical protein
MPSASTDREQPAAVSDRRDAEADQIVSRQLGQNFCVDVVVAKSQRVTFGVQPAQPCRHIHQSRPQ